MAGGERSKVLNGSKASKSNKRGVTVQWRQLQPISALIHISMRVGDIGGHAQSTLIFPNSDAMGCVGHWQISLATTSKF